MTADRNRGTERPSSELPSSGLPSSGLPSSGLPASGRPLEGRELERVLASIEPESRLRPPADLLASIRKEIPEELPARRPANDGRASNDGAAGGAATGAGWWQRHRYAIAAAFVVVAATGLLTVRLGRLASPERLAATAAREAASQPAAEPAQEPTRLDGQAREDTQESRRSFDDAVSSAPDSSARNEADRLAGESDADDQPRESRSSEGPAATRPDLRADASAGGRGADQALRNEMSADAYRSKAADQATQPDGAPELEGRVARIVGGANGEQADDAAGQERDGEAVVAEEITVTSRTPVLDVRKLQQGATVRIPTAPASRPPAERQAAGERGDPEPRVAELRKQKEALESELRGRELRALGYVDSAASADANAVEAEPAPAAPAPPAPPAADAMTRARRIDPPARPADLDASFDAMQFRPAPTNPFVDPAEDPLSTFGLDVDTGSYTLARRYLDLDRLPPAESVRVEEYVNFFDYGDAPPRRGDFAVRLEAGPSVFAPEGAERLMLRVGVRARDVEARDRKPAALIFLVDVSGSMQRENRLELVKRSLELLIDELGPDDSIGLVVYSSNARAVLEPTRDHDAIRQAIARLVPEGSTNLEDGLGIAYEMASRARPARSSGELIRRVILCSDGVANVGVTDPESLLRGVADWAQQGVELTTVGFGMGNYNDELMERLADRGDGSYAYVDSLREARRIFVENLTGTLQTVAADARIQVELDPEVVASYRLLGYANRAIPDAAFRDERVDAGEIGAGHRVSALYELELARGAARSDTLATVRLRWRSKESGQTEEVEETIQGRDAIRSWSSSPASLRLAQVVAGFAERLGRSPHTGASLDELFREGQAVLGDFPGRLDVARLVTEIGEARDLELEAERRR